MKARRKVCCFDPDQRLAPRDTVSPPMSSTVQGGGKRRSAIKLHQRECGRWDRREAFVGGQSQRRRGL